MKKAVAAILLSIFLFNTVGYYIVFKTAQSEIKSKIKKELKMQVNSDELTSIRFSREEAKKILWVKKGKEFIHLDQMFDIVRTTTNGSDVVYHCINDKQEKKLFVHLEEHVSKQLENNKNSKSKNLIKTDYFEEHSLVIFRQFSSLSFLKYNRNYAVVAPAITVPPPRI